MKRGHREYRGGNAYFKKGKQQTIEKIRCRACMEKKQFFKKTFIWRSKELAKKRELSY